MRHFVVKPRKLSQPHYEQLCHLKAFANNKGTDQLASAPADLRADLHIWCWHVGLKRFFSCLGVGRIMNW